jgi:hypothetical protein
MLLFKLLQKPYNKFASNTSSQDLFKALAMFAMILDHLGLFFWPEITILRAIGRISAPIWLFFCGYNYKPESKFSYPLLLGAIAVQASQIFIAKSFLPLNILFSMIFARFFMRYYYQTNLQKWIGWSILWVIALSSFSYSNKLFEYGGFAFLCCIWGYDIRNNQSDKEFKSFSIYVFILLCWLTIFKGFAQICFVILVSITVYCLNYFEYKWLEIKDKTRLLINIMARYSLYIYVMHVVLFRFFSQLQ